MATWSADWIQAVRGLRRSPVLAATAIVCLALGLGTGTAALQVVDRLFFAPPAHVRNSGGLTRMYIRQSIPGIGWTTSDSTSYPNYVDLRQAGIFAALGAFSPLEVPVRLGSDVRKIPAVLVTGSLLGLLEVRPLQGRLLSAEEGEAAAPSSAVLVGEDFWRREMGATPSVLGSPLRVGRTVFTVVGILPAGFTGVDLEPVDLWLPLNAARELAAGPQWATSRGSSYLTLVGRIAPGASEAAAGAAGSEVLKAALREDGETDPQARLVLGPVQRARGPNRPAGARIALGAAVLAGAVLLIACSNVAHLLLIRALERQREIAVRLALGAGRGRIARLVLAESLVLAALGGGAGWALWRLAMLRLPTALVQTGGPSFREWGLLAALVLAGGLLCSVLPAAWAVGSERAGGLRRRVADGGRGQLRLRQALLAGQIALSFLLLIGCGVFVRNLRELVYLRPGFDADRVWVAQRAEEAEVDDIGAGWAEAALERVRHLPGVEQAALATSVPFEASVAFPVEIPGRAEPPVLPTGGPYLTGVTADFFSALGARILRGRPLDATEPRSTAVVNATLARLAWPGEEALGRCLRIGGAEAPCAEVVGVVEDLRRAALREEPTMQVYVPLAALPAALPRALFVRVAAREEARFRAGVLRREVQRLAGPLAFVEVRRLADLAEPEIRPWRAGAAALTLFGALALCLAGVGLGGAISQAVVRRAAEWGVRIALGAGRRSLWASLFGQAGQVVAVGLAAGGVLAFLAGRPLARLLPGLELLDPGVWFLAAAVLAAVALLATLLAGRRLRSIRPAAVLRAE